MKKAILLLVVLSILSVLPSWAQPAQPLEVGGSVLTSAPTTQDSIEIYSFARLTTTSYKYYGIISRSDDTFKVSYCILKGRSQAPSGYEDTFRIGLLPAGIYTLLIEGNLSKDSCENKLYYAYQATNFTITSSTGVSFAKSRENADISVSPNPTRSQQEFTVTLKDPGLYTIKLYDVQGRIIQLVHDGKLNAGKNKFSVNLFNLSPGLYYYILEVNGEKQSIKVLKY